MMTDEKKKNPPMSVGEFRMCQGIKNAMGKLRHRITDWAKRIDCVLFQAVNDMEVFLRHGYARMPHEVGDSLDVCPVGQ